MFPMKMARKVGAGARGRYFGAMRAAVNVHAKKHRRGALRGAACAAGGVRAAKAA